MNSGPTSERVHAAIKHRILTRAALPGERLDPAILAQSLSSSITPIRDALHLLAGQGLVTTGTGEGFHVPHIDEPALTDLYGWALELLTLALRSWPVARVRPGEYQRATEPGDPAGTIAALGLTIARGSPNAEHLRAVRSLNDRLHPLRLVEPIVIGSPDPHLGPLAAAVATQDRAQLRRHLLAYHRLRQRRAAAIVRAHYRN